VYSWYGPDKVAVLKIDGQIVSDIARKYSVPSYPYFIHISPNSNGKLQSVYKYAPRNYDTLKRWFLESMGNTPTLPGVRLGSPREDEEVVRVRE
jgi:hypothetical protein